MFISYFTLKSNYHELKKDYLKSLNKQKQLEKRYTNELNKINSILNQVLDNQKNAEAVSNLKTFLIKTAYLKAKHARKFC